MSKAKRPITRFIASLVITIGITAAVFCGCQSQSGVGIPEVEIHEGKIQARIVVTRDFGSQLMLDELVMVDSDANAMDALRQVAEIETAYGGGFVNAINGVRSGYAGGHTSKEDWFISINGITTNTGALDYSLHPGDTEHWDFHDWSFHQFVPALIGDFPEPFLHGYGGVVYPTIIAYQDGWEEDARRLADSLNKLGVVDVAAMNINEPTAAEKEASNLILLGTADCLPVAEINQVWKRLGLYIHSQNGSLEVFDSRGELAARYGAGTGFIQATQSLWNPKGIGVCENVVWVVSGTDETGVTGAVDTIVNHHGDFKYACAVAITSGEIVRVPQ